MEQFTEFANCIRNQESSEVGGEEGMQALAVILAAVRSAQSRGPVKLAEILVE